MRRELINVDIKVDDSLMTDREYALKHFALAHGKANGMANGYADNSVVCDSRNNCIVRDSLYCSGEACNQQNGAAHAAPVSFPGAMGLPSAMGIPTGAMPMGIPTGAMPMGIPTGAMPMGNMGYKTMGYADNSTVCDSRGNCMIVDSLLTTKDCLAFTKVGIITIGGNVTLPKGCKLLLEKVGNLGIGGHLTMGKKSETEDEAPKKKKKDTTEDEPTEKPSEDEDKPKTKKE